ncbi:histidine kinase [Shewanella sp.]|uniref:histidine kinase n=1 Tax=Shewanella sp. TaxID=50422 RepID=UPI0025856042|nr:histidine kinase [Shewanella sp.]MCJ8301105.1 GGDEF domain-containing protein [Shewanella sp.]
MIFRIVVLCLTFWLAPAWANTQDRLDTIDRLLYQYPSQALSEINTLENITSPIKLTETDKLRLSLLRCETFLQLGENEAAINIARMNEAKAKILKLDQARPYFLNCMAAAFSNYGDYRQALPILDSSIKLSRELKQPQSLVNGLRLRGIIDTQMDSYSSAFEDLGLASDIYSDTQFQAVNWVLAPRISITLAMSQLLAKNSQFKLAYQLLEKALVRDDPKGKVLLTASIQVAKMAQLNRSISSDQLIKEAKNLLPELETAFELAVSYKDIAQLEYNRANYNRAIQLLEVSLHTFIKQKSTIEKLRTQRLLAEVLLTSGNQPKAMTLMNQAIATGLETSKYHELVLCYQVLSAYYVRQGNFEQAYHYQVLKFDAAENTFNFIKDTRLQQLNTRLSRQQIAHSALDKHGPILGSQTQFKSEYMLLTLFILVALITIRQRRKSTKLAQVPKIASSLGQRIDKLIGHSKLVGFHLSLILIDSRHIFHADRPILQTRLENLLREQDIITTTIDKEVVILLPHTQEKGTLKIIEQIKAVMLPLQQGDRANIGYAKLQQQDSLESLIKRAKVKLLMLKNRKQASLSTETA